MRKIRLYIAMSLDGYIADKNGGVSWLSGHGQDEENIDTYSEFIKNVDTVIMGWNTYHQIVTELSPQEWVYADLKSYVITHRNRSVSKDTHLQRKISHLHQSRRVSLRKICEAVREKISGYAAGQRSSVN